MSESFHTEADRHWAGWSRRVTWRKMEEKKKLVEAKKLKWRQLSIVPQSYLAAVSVLTSGHNLLPRFLWELGKWGGKGNWTRGTSDDKSKAGTGGRRGGRGREQRGGADGPKIDLGQRQRLDSALPETKGHLPSGRQEGASQWLDLRRKMSGSFRSHPC